MSVSSHDTVSVACVLTGAAPSTHMSSSPAASTGPFLPLPPQAPAGASSASPALPQAPAGASPASPAPSAAAASPAQTASPAPEAAPQHAVPANQAQMTMQIMEPTGELRPLFATLRVIMLQFAC